jgi:O-antigen ligase
MRVALYVLAFLNSLVWGALSFVGGSILQGAAEYNHLPDYPSKGLIIHYVILPLALAVTAIVVVVLTAGTRREKVGIAVLSITLAFLPFYFLGFTGGM